MGRHVFTTEERSRGGKARVYTPDGAYRQDFLEMCEKGYYALQIRKPGIAMWIYKQKVKPHMRKKG